MRRSGGHVGDRARSADHRAFADADFDLAGNDQEALIPIMRMGWWTLAGLAFLAEDFVSAGRRTRCQHRDVLAEHIERAGQLTLAADEGCAGHVELLCSSRPAG